MNPDDLLQQIRALLDQYLALGGDTPVAPEAQALADAIDSAGGGAMPPAEGAGMGEGPMDQSVDQMPMMGGGTPMPDIAGMAPEGGVPTGSTLADASRMAEEDIKKRMKGPRR